LISLFIFSGLNGMPVSLQIILNIADLICRNSLIRLTCTTAHGNSFTGNVKKLRAPALN